MEKLSFKIADFDAPLDLILHLISKHRLNIFDIDISSLLQQYMNTIHSWRESNMDIASDFLEVASRLVYIKTVSLLPRHEEESDKLRDELAGQLMEYRLLKLAAQRLGEWDMSGSIFFRAPMAFEADNTYILTHPAGILYSALMDAQGKGSRRLPPPRESFEPLVTRPVVSVTSKIFSLLRMLRKTGHAPLSGIFGHSRDKSSLVATFLAILELVKTKKIMILEDEVFINGS